MPQAGMGASPYILPNAYNQPGDVLNLAIQNQRQDKEIARQEAYRKQKEDEADQWKKLAMIQDLTDLSKHQTASDVANAIGNQQASAILQKYTQSASKMQPDELMYNVQKDMSGLVSGMDAMKNELEQSDEQLKQLKQTFPTLNISALAQQTRADVLHRRLKDANSFVNPLEVPQSQMDLMNPDFLSKYIASDKTLSEAITNPKGTDESTVFMGNPDSYTEFSAKIPIWKKPNFDPNTLQHGFMKGNTDPSLEIKATEIPSTALPSSNGKPFRVIDKDVYDRFTQDGALNLELTAATRQAYPSYDNFNPTEKEYAKRNILLSKIESLDQSNFHPTKSVRPPRTSIRVNTGGSGSASGQNVNDIYGRIYNQVKRLKDYGEQETPGTTLNSDEQAIILDAVNKDRTENDKLPIEDVRVRLSDNNELLVFDKEGNLKTTLPYIGTNLKVQPGVKEKRTVIAQGTKSTPSPKKDPLGIL